MTDHAFTVLDNCIEQGISRMRNFQRALVENGHKLKAYSIDKIVDVDHAGDIATAEAFLNSWLHSQPWKSKKMLREQQLAKLPTKNSKKWWLSAKVALCFFNAL